MAPATLAETAFLCPTCHRPMLAHTEGETPASAQACTMAMATVFALTMRHVIEKGEFE